MLVLKEADVRRAMSMAEALEATRIAYMAISTGGAHVPLRHHIPAEGGGVGLVMSGFVPESRSYGVKFVSVMPENRDKGLPVTLGSLLLFNPETGEPLALIDATFLTALRTGAGVGVATDLLARQDAKHVGIIGTGGQASAHVEAVWSVRDIEVVYAHNRTYEKAEQFCVDMQERAKQQGRSIRFEVMDTPRAAVMEADVIVATTNASSPVVMGSWLRPGVHVNAAGSHEPSMQEIDEEVVTKASVIAVDSRSGATVPGDLAIPLKRRLVASDKIVEVGEILSGASPLERLDSDITLFKSVGHASQDLVAGRLIYEKARSLSLGTEIQL